MKTRIATSMFVLVLMALGMVSAVSGQDTPSLTIHPLAVMLKADASQFFEAKFSDDSPIAFCSWTATGVGHNGVTLTTTERNWAVFYDGNLRGVNYAITANCKNMRGLSSSARAYVFVK